MPSAEGRILPVELTREQVRNSPTIDADKPVSRQNEARLVRVLRLVSRIGEPAAGDSRGMLVRATGIRGEPDRAAIAPAGGSQSAEHAGGCGLLHLGDRVGRSAMSKISSSTTRTGSLRYSRHRHPELAPGQTRARLSRMGSRDPLAGESRFAGAFDGMRSGDSPPYDPNQPVNRQDEVSPLRSITAGPGTGLEPREDRRSDAAVCQRSDRGLCRRRGRRRNRKASGCDCRVGAESARDTTTAIPGDNLSVRSERGAFP